MKKLIALFCVVALLSCMASVAFAAGSPSEPTVTTPDTTEEKTPGAKVRKIDTDDIEDAKLKNVIEKINDPEVQTLIEAKVSKAQDGDETATEDVKAAVALTPEEVTEMFEVSEESKKAAEEVLKGDYDWVSTFFEIVNEEDEKSDAPIKTPVMFDTLKGEKAENLSDYLIMFISKDGEITFIELDATSFDPETGTVNVEFPCQGVFALIQK